MSAVEGAGVVGHPVEIVGRRRAARGRLPAVVATLDEAGRERKFIKNAKTQL